MHHPSAPAATSQKAHATRHPNTRPAELTLPAPSTPHATRWLRLAVHSHVQLTDTEAQVTFTATYREDGRAHRMEECSRFVLEDGKWFYVEGVSNFSNTDSEPI